MFYGIVAEQSDPEALFKQLSVKEYHVWLHKYCLVHGLYGIWCSFQGGWYVLILLVGET